MGKEANSSPESGQPEPGNSAAIKIGDKSYTVDEVQDMMTTAQSLKKNAESVSAVLDVVNRYGVEPEVYVQQAQSAFAVMQDLIDQGIIDNEGNIIGKPADKDTKSHTPPEGTPPSRTPVPDNTGEKILEIVRKAVEPLQQKIQTLESDQTAMLRMDMQRQVQAQFPNLDDGDVSRLFGTAMNDKTKTLLQHADAMSKAKSAREMDLRRKHAEEFGINLDEFDANKLHEQDSRGAAISMLGDRRPSFKDKKTNPRKLMMDFMKRQR